MIVIPENVVALSEYETRAIALAVAYLRVNICDVEDMHEEHPFPDFIVRGRAMPLPSEEMLTTILEKVRPGYDQI